MLSLKRLIALRNCSKAKENLQMCRFTVLLQVILGVLLPAYMLPFNVLLIVLWLIGIVLPVKEVLG